MNDTTIYGIIIIVIIACLGVLGWSIYNAIRTSRENKATEAANRTIFMAKMEKLEEESKKKGKIEERVDKAPLFNKQPVDLEHVDTDWSKIKSLDYDHYDNQEIPNDANDKGLRDFFKG